MPERDDLKPGWIDFSFEMADFRHDKAYFRPVMADFRQERANLKSQRVDFRKNIRPERWMDQRTDKSNSPSFLQDLFCKTSSLASS